MDLEKLMHCMAWVAVFILAIGYWAQVFKITIHREVRDLSIVSYSLLAVGFAILTYTAWVEDSNVFIAKQILTLAPSLIIVFQIIYHRDDHWHDGAAKGCAWCGTELETGWRHCPDCGTAVNKPLIQEEDAA